MIRRSGIASRFLSSRCSKTYRWHSLPAAQPVRDLSASAGQPGGLAPLSGWARTPGSAQLR